MFSLQRFQYQLDEFLMPCDGLPLSLRVVRALLCRENDKSYWEDKLDRLQQVKVPN